MRRPQETPGGIADGQVPRLPVVAAAYDQAQAVQRLQLEFTREGPGLQGVVIVQGAQIIGGRGAATANLF